MTSLLVVGSIALDTVETPFGSVNDALGGSATYFSLSASFFTRVNIVGVVGRDFPSGYLRILASRGADLRGLAVTDGKTFRWKGRYGFDLNNVETLKTELNVFRTFRPRIPRDYASSPFVFLANIDPDLQQDVLGQVGRPRFTACDTMEYWITGKRRSLLKTLKLVDALIINEAEARELSGEANLVRASRKIFSMGPTCLVVKRGEYGAVLLRPGMTFFAPGYPLENVFDPTGAGDTFAGGFMGWLARSGSVSEASLKKAVIAGSTMASFAVQGFSVDHLVSLKRSAFKKRMRQFRALTAH